MKARHKRFLLIAIGMTILSLGAWLVLSAFQKNLVFFFTPTQISNGEAPEGRSFRLGGMVEEGSLKRQADGITMQFVVTDTVRKVPVHYKGILPDLFKEGKGVVAQGKLESNGQFMAAEVLAKHDENYMPPEAAYAMEQAKEAKAAKAAAAATAAAEAKVGLAPAQSLPGTNTLQLKEKQ